MISLILHRSCGRSCSPPTDTGSKTGSSKRSSGMLMTRPVLERFHVLCVDCCITVFCIVGLCRIRYAMLSSISPQILEFALLRTAADLTSGHCVDGTRRKPGSRYITDRVPGCHERRGTPEMKEAVMGWSSEAWDLAAHRRYCLHLFNSQVDSGEHCLLLDCTRPSVMQDMERLRFYGAAVARPVCAFFWRSGIVWSLVRNKF